MNTTKRECRDCDWSWDWSWDGGAEWKCMCPLPQWVVLEDVGFGDIPPNSISPNDDARDCDHFEERGGKK